MENKEDLSTKPLVDIFNEMSYLEQEIGIKQIKHDKEMEKLILKFERLRLEVIKRFPVMEDKEPFKPMVKEKTIYGRNI